MLAFSVPISALGHPSVLWLQLEAAGRSLVPLGLAGFPLLQPPSPCHLGFLCLLVLSLLDCLYLELRSLGLYVPPWESSGPWVNLRSVASAHAKPCGRSLGRGRGCDHAAAFLLLSLNPQLCVSLSLQCIVRILPRALRKAR